MPTTDAELLDQQLLVKASTYEKPRFLLTPTILALTILKATILKSNHPQLLPKGAKDYQEIVR